MLSRVLNLEIRKDGGAGTPRWPVLLFAALGLVIIAPLTFLLWSMMEAMRSKSDMDAFVLIALIALYLFIKTIAEVFPLRDAARWRSQVEQGVCTKCGYQVGHSLPKCPECGIANTFPVELDSDPPASCFRGKGVLLERVLVSVISFAGLVFSIVFYFASARYESFYSLTGICSAYCLNAQLAPSFRRYFHVFIGLVVLGVSIASLFLPGDKKGWFVVFALAALYSLWRNLFGAKQRQDAAT